MVYRIRPFYFSENTYSWEQRKLGDILSESRIYGSNGKNANKLTVRLWGKGVVAKDDLLQGSEATQYFIRKAGQFIYGKLDFLNQAFGIIPDKLDGYESTLDAPAFDIDTNVNGKFLLEYISREHFYLHYGNLANGSRKAKRVHTNVVLDMPFIAPSFEEQTAIGNFFKQLDETIALHQRQTEKYQKLRQGFLQSIFQTEKPQISLKNTNAWEQRKLGEVLKIKSGMSQKGIEIENGIYPILATGGEIGRTNTALYNKESVLIGRKGTIDKPFYMNTPFWTVDTLFYSELSSYVTGQFIYTLFQKIKWRNFDTSTGVPSLTSSTIHNIEVKIPSLPEQTTIGNFFKQLDETIALHQRQIEKYRLIKKLFLEKMFIK